MVNNSCLGGYVTVEEGAFISGGVVAHQFTRIGTLAMVSGLSGLNKDLPPYMIGQGRPVTVHGINTIGLRRAGVTPEARRQIQEAYQVLYRSDHLQAEAVEILARDETPEVQHLVQFIKKSSRGIAHPLDPNAKFQL